MEKLTETTVYSTKEKHVSKKEMLQYMVGLGGQNMLYSLIGAGFFTVFLNTYSGMDAAVSGVIILILKIWDGINDPIIGSIMDRINFKNGEKIRPWLKVMPPIIAVTTTMVFLTPILPSGFWKYLFFTLSYAVWDIAYSLQDVPIWSITAMVSPNPEERENFIKWARTTSSISFGIFTAAIPMLYSILIQIIKGPSQTKVILPIMCASFAFLGAGLSRLCYAAKERVPLIKKQDSLKEGFSLLFKNKMMLLLSLANILGAVGVGTNLMYQFFQFEYPMTVFGIQLDGNMTSTVIGGVIYAPSTVAMLFADKIKKKMGGSFVTTMIVAQIFCAVARVIAFFIGYSTPTAFWFGVVVQAIGTTLTGILTIAQTSLFSDSIDYIEWKTGMRTEGVTFAMQTLFSKVSSGINQGLTGVILGNLMHYTTTDNPEIGGFQPEAFHKWIWPMLVLTPAVAALLYIIPLFFIKYTQKQKDLVLSDLEARRENRPESGESPYYQKELKHKFEAAQAAE